MNPVTKAISTLTISVAAAVLIACGQQTAPAPPLAPDTPVPAPTVETAPAQAQAVIQPQAPMPPPTPMPAAVPMAQPTMPPLALTIEPTPAAPLSIFQATPEPEPVVREIPEPTATAEPIPEPTATEIPPTPVPVPTLVPPTPAPTQVPQAPVPPTAIPEPTATFTPEPTPAPADTYPPYVIVVDFYSGNTFNDPGAENCNPARCGGALVQFSEPVLTEGRLLMDVLGKRLLECAQGCSTTEPSPFMIFSGVWVEAGDELVTPEILRDGSASITDVSGNEIGSYEIGAVKARVSDFAMIQGPTPVPTPVPSSRSNEPPYVKRVKYVDTTVELHLSEPVTASYLDIADVGIIVRHANGETERGTCIEPCNGDNALLTFLVPGMHASSIAARFELLNGAEVYDGDGQNITHDFEQRTIAQASVIEGIRVLPVDPSGEWFPYDEIQVSLTRRVWINATEMYLEFNTGARVPYKGQYSPKYLATLILFGYSLDVPEENIPRLYEGDVLERIVIDGWMETPEGLAVQDITFDPITLTR